MPAAQSVAANSAGSGGVDRNMAMLEIEFELNEIDENLLGAGMAAQHDIRDARVAEIEKLATDFHAFEPTAKGQVRRKDFALALGGHDQER